MVRLIGMRSVLVVTMLASCSAPGSAPTPTPPRPSTPASVPADAASSAFDAGIDAGPAPPSDAAVTRPSQLIDVPASARRVACPTPSSTTPGPRWTTPLETWRSRAELPACIAAAIPADVDFDREMLVAELPRQVRKIELKSPLSATRDGTWLIVEEQVPYECPVCSGVALPPPPPRPMPPTLVWRIPRETGITPVLRMRPARACPPCMAP